jgi:hypothetical protein
MSHPKFNDSMMEKTEFLYGKYRWNRLLLVMY